MQYSSEGSFQRQFNFLRRQFLQDGELPFTDGLSRETLSEALETIQCAWNDRVYTPLVTLWVFLGQVISADHSCRNAVARLIVHRVSQGLRPCSPRTGAYCQARKRLPERFFSTIARSVGRKLEDETDEKSLWKGRHVLMFDGTTVSMPDTRENQAQYPQVYNQKPGLGFPIARVCTIISLSCGAVLDLGNLPDYLEIREVSVRVEQPGFRTKKLVIVTTILDPNEASKEDLAGLYRSRWSQELDIRDIKISLQMDVLRCKTPELVRKEIWTHILAYNLVRTVMAQAATHVGIQPREISFKGTLQTLEAFQPLISFQCRATLRQQLYLQLLEAVATHRVADRPDRYEPRQRKRKPRTAVQMTKPRKELKRLMRKGVTEI